MFYLILSFIGLADFGGVQFSVYDAMGWQWNTKDIHHAVNGNATYGEFLVSFGDFLIGTAYYYLTRIPTNVTITDTIDGTPYQWNITGGTETGTYLPVILGYTFYRKELVDFSIMSRVSLWSNGFRRSHLIDSTDARIYEITVPGDRLINLCLEMHVPIAKGLELLLSTGGNIIHYNKTVFPDEVIPGLNHLEDWEVSPYFSIHGKFFLIPGDFQGDNPINTVKFLSTSIAGGLLRVGYLALYTRERMRFDYSPNKAYGIAIGTGFTSSLIQSSISYFSLKKGRDNNILDYITIGISTGILTGLIDGVMCDVIDYNPFGMCYYQPVIEGVAGGIMGVINYLICED